MKLARRILEWTLNVLTLLVAVALLGLLGRRYLFPTGDMNSLPVALRPGAPVDLPNLDWKANGTTLIIAMRIGCHWCEVSSGLYRDILASNSEKAFHTVIVLPDPEAESRTYLGTLGIHASDVRQADISKLGIPGTPTLILVGSSGSIRASWVGKLSEERESEVFNRLQIRRIKAGTDQTVTDKTLTESNEQNRISSSDFVHLLRAKKTIPVIDVRPRRDFGQGHIAGALNIPLDELEARASHEIPKSRPVFVFCNYYAPCESRLSSQGLSSYCGMSNSVLKMLGFTKLKVASDNLDQLRRLGAPVTGIFPEANMASVSEPRK